MAVSKLVQSCCINGGPVPVEANGDPECVETNGEQVSVEGNGDTVETNGDPVGSTNREREHEPVCTGISRGG